MACLWAFREQGPVVYAGQSLAMLLLPPCRYSLFSTHYPLLSLLPQAGDELKNPIKVKLMGFSCGAVGWNEGWAWGCVFRWPAESKDCVVGQAFQGSLPLLKRSLIFAERPFLSGKGQRCCEPWD